MIAEQVAFLGWLAYRFRNLIPVLEEHLRDQEGAVLTHVLMADIGRWVLGRFLKNGSDDGELNEMLSELENAFANEGRQISELIAVSFLENLPRPEEDGGDIRELVGPRLREQLALIG